MMQTFHAQGFLLSEHDVFGSLARELLDGTDSSRGNKRWTIVCERKEDLLAVRTQIFSLLSQIHAEKHPGRELKAWAGISLYTPDTLVRNFSLTLCHNQPEQLGSDHHALLNKPFTDIVEQEKLMRLLLLRLGYGLSDVAPLAKQILTLADTPLPADESFLSLLLEVHHSPQSQKNILDIPDNSLRTICVAYQLAQKIFASFGRLQTFVTQYWTTAFPTQLRAHLEGEEDYRDFLLPKKFLSEPLLWISAPEYSRESDSYRPGNFQAALIDALRDGLFSARELWAHHHKKSAVSWWARTHIPTAVLVPSAPTANVHVYGTFAALTDTFNRKSAEADADTQFLLGDLNKRILNTVRSDGSGIHALTPRDFEPSTEIGDSESQTENDHWQNPAREKIIQLREEFMSYWKRLSAFDETIQEALARYDLSPSARRHGITFELMLHRFFDGETFNFAVSDEINQLPPALSLLPSLNSAKKFVVLGPPHSPTAPSFHLRLLNAVFYALRSKQVALDPIASEESYRGYWQSILSADTQITFLLRTQKELEDFPEYARRWCLPPLQIQTWSETILPDSAFAHWLSNGNRLHDPEWARLLKSRPPAPNVSSMGVTDFEDYVECPLQYYWVRLHGLNADAQPELQPDALMTGQRAHSMAEKLIGGLRQMCLVGDTALGNEKNVWLKLFARLQHEFLVSDAYLSASPEAWSAGFLNALISEDFNSAQNLHARALSNEMTDIIFSIGTQDGEPALSPVKNRLVRETLRRAFRKLIQSELHDVQRGEDSPAEIISDRRTEEIRGAFLEQPVRFEIHPQLILTGRIDRIDSHPKGDRIIDYKTSKVSKNDPQLVLDPRLAKSTNRLSVQGAIYSLAWARRVADEAGNDNNSANQSTRGVRAFSLLRLKTLDLSREPYSNFEFDSPLRLTDETFSSLKDEYNRRAIRLVEGDFSPRPLTPSICQWCPLQSVCPAAGQLSGDAS